MNLVYDLKETTYYFNQYIYKQGQFDPHVYFLLEGEVETIYDITRSLGQTNRNLN